MLSLIHHIKVFGPSQSCNLNHKKDGQSPKALSITTYIHHNHRNLGKHKSIYSLYNSKAKLSHSLSYKNLATHVFDQTIHKRIRRHWIEDIKK